MARLGSMPKGGIALMAAAALLAAGCGSASDAGSRRAPQQTAQDPSRLPPAGAQFGRNVVRVPGLSPADVAGAAALAAYPPDRGVRPTGLVLTQDTAWRELLVSAQLAAAPVNAAILPIKRDYLPTATSDLVGRLHPTGFKKAHGLQALVLGAAGRDVFADLQDAGLKLSQLKAASSDRLAEKLVPYRAGFAGHISSTIVIASSADPAYALPAAAWSAFSGDTVALVGRRSIPASTRRVLAQRPKLRLEKPTMYVVAPPSVVSARVADQLRAYGTVKRIAGRTPAEVSVALARYRDARTGFGWGVRHAPASVSLVDARDWADGAGALMFAARGPRAPVLVLDRPDALPPAIERYIADLSGSEPSQAFAFGGERAIATSVLAKLDALLAAGATGA